MSAGVVGEIVNISEDGDSVGISGGSILPSEGSSGSSGSPSKSMVSMSGTGAELGEGVGEGEGVGDGVGEGLGDATGDGFEDPKHSGLVRYFGGFAGIITLGLEGHGNLSMTLELCTVLVRAFMPGRVCNSQKVGPGFANTVGSEINSPRNILLGIGGLIVDIGGDEVAHIAAEQVRRHSGGNSGAKCFYSRARR